MVEYIIERKEVISELTLDDLTATDLKKDTIDKLNKVVEISKIIDEGLFNSLQNNDNDYVELIKLYGVGTYNSFTDLLNRVINKSCPLCLNSDFDSEKIKRNIDTAFQIIKENDNFERVLEAVEILKKCKETVLVKKCITVLQKLLNNDYEGYLKDIDLIVYNIEKMSSNYDDILCKIILDDNEFDIQLASYISNCDNIDRIVNLNQEILYRDVDEEENIFVKVLNTLFNHVCDYLNIEAYLDIDSEKAYFISLKYRGRTKDGVSLSVLFDDILSESEKGKISLCFFIAKVIVSDLSNKFVILDDPYDSYDSESLYFMSKIIFEFLTGRNNFNDSPMKPNCIDYSVIFTHSKELITKHFDIPDSEVSTNAMFFNANGILILNKVDIPLLQNDILNIIEKIKEINTEDVNDDVLKSMIVYASAILYRDFLNNHIKNIEHMNDIDLYKCVTNDEANEIINYISEHFMHSTINSSSISASNIYSIFDYLSEKNIFNININKPTNDSLLLCPEFFSNIYNFKTSNLQMELLRKVCLVNLIRLKYDYVSAYLCLYSKILSGQSVSKKVNQNLIRERFYSGLNNIYDSGREEVVSLINNVKTNYFSSILLTNDFAHYSNSDFSPFLHVSTDYIYSEHKRILDIMSNEDFGNIIKKVDSYQNWIIN